MLSFYSRANLGWSYCSKKEVERMNLVDKILVLLNERGEQSKQSTEYLDKSKIYTSQIKLT